MILILGIVIVLLIVSWARQYRLEKRIKWLNEYCYVFAIAMSQSKDIHSGALKFIDLCAYRLPSGEYDKAMEDMCSSLGVRFSLDNEGYLVSERTKQNMALAIQQIINDRKIKIKNSEFLSRPVSTH